MTLRYFLAIQQIDSHETPISLAIFCIEILEFHWSCFLMIWQALGVLTGRFSSAPWLMSNLAMLLNLFYCLADISCHDTKPLCTHNSAYLVHSMQIFFLWLDIYTYLPNLPDSWENFLIFVFSPCFWAKVKSSWFVAFPFFNFFLISKISKKWKEKSHF